MDHVVGDRRELVVAESRRNVAVDGFASSPVIGYDKVSAIARQANDEASTLREASSIPALSM